MLGYLSFLSYFNSCSKNSVEYNICKAIIENIGSLDELRVSDLTAMSNTSEPSIKRFWKVLGFNSFQQMKSQIYSSYQEFYLGHHTATGFLFSTEGARNPEPEIMSRTVIDSLSKLVKNYDFSQIEKFSDYLLSEATELLVCSNIQLPSLMFLQALFGMAGMIVNAPMFLAAQREQLERIPAKSAVLLCGSAWYTNTMFGELVDRARANGVAVAVCVDSMNTPISKRADFNLSFTPPTAPPYYLFSFVLENLALNYVGRAM